MKKIYGAFLAVLMLGCFVGCNNNPSDDSSSKDDSLLGEITYTKPILPESVGKDPFEGLTELVTDSNEKFLVNTELKTISSCDSEGNIAIEYEYSYKNTDDGVILSVVISKIRINGELVLAENCGIGLENMLKDVIKGHITDDFDYYDEYYGSEYWNESNWQERIDSTNFEYGTSFTKDNYNKGNFDWIFDQIISTPKTKENIFDTYSFTVNRVHEIYNYKIDITNINGTQADFDYEGIYDESKKWYEQTSVYFYGYHELNDDHINVVVMFYDSFIDDYRVYSIDDSSIKTFYYDENNIKQYKTFNYTKTGSGRDTVISIVVDGQIVNAHVCSMNM